MRRDETKEEHYRDKLRQDENETNGDKVKTDKMGGETRQNNRKGETRGEIQNEEMRKKGKMR